MGSLNLTGFIALLIMIFCTYYLFKTACNEIIKSYTNIKIGVNFTIHISNGVVILHAKFSVMNITLHIYI